MAGAAPTPSGKGGKKALDAQINLVPFIDLLSCCICFLLITAVWVNLAGMETNQRVPAKKAIEESLGNVTQLVLYVDQDGYLFKVRKDGRDQAQERIPLSKNKLDRETLKKVLEQVRKTYSKQNDVILLVADQIKWDQVIKTMETVASVKKENGDNHFAVQLSDQTTFESPPTSSSNPPTEIPSGKEGGKK